VPANERNPAPRPANVAGANTYHRIVCRRQGSCYEPRRDRWDRHSTGPAAAPGIPADRPRWDDPLIMLSLYCPRGDHHSGHAEKLFQEMRNPVFVVGACDAPGDANGSFMGIRNRDTETAAF
jgi:hypothetical protein